MAFFDDPPVKPAPTAEKPVETPTTEQPITEPQPQPKSEGSGDWQTLWEQPTEYRETKESTDPDNEDIEDDKEDVGMDPEAADFAADLAVNMNQEGMSRLLHWMHAEGQPTDYRAANEGVLHKAWHRFFVLMNIQITANKGVLFANLVAFGWSFGIGIWKLISRIVSGAFRWPWSRKKKRSKEDQTAEFAEQIIDISKDQPQPQQPPPPPVDPWENIPHNVCMETGEKFKKGTGFMRNPDHEYHDKFASRSAMQKWKERLKREEAQAKKAGKTTSTEIQPYPEKNQIPEPVNS